MTRKDEGLLVGLDIGTNLTKVAVAEVDGEHLQILGVGQAPSVGVREGRVVNVGQVTASVEQAVEEAEVMSGIEIKQVHVVISGGVLRSINRKGMAPVRNGEVTRQEIDKVRETATALPLAADERVMAVVSQGYAVDDTAGVFNPNKLAATCLHGRYHLVTVSDQASRNIRRCCEELGIDVVDYHIESLASAAGVLDEDEKELGVLLLDIGAGTTSYVAFQENVLVHTGALPLAGGHLVSDLAHGLKTPTGEAERLLKDAGCVDERALRGEELFELPALGSRTPRALPREAMVELLQPRAEEILHETARQFQRGGVAIGDLASGVVVTGGVANLDGMVELASEVFEAPARLGKPVGIGGLAHVVERPTFSALVGLMKSAASHDLGTRQQAESNGVVGWVRSLF